MIKKILNAQKVAPFIFVLPFIISFCIFWIYPLFSTVKMSFQSILPNQVEWVGFENYAKLLKDTAFHTAIKNSFVYMLLSLCLLIPFPMLYAVMIDSNIVKRNGLWEALIYLPALTSVVITGQQNRLIISKYANGTLDDILCGCGEVNIDWLKMGSTVSLGVLVLATWLCTGVIISF